VIVIVPVPVGVDEGINMATWDADV